MKLNRLQKILLGAIGLLLAFSLILDAARMSSPLTYISQEGYGFFSLIKYSLIDYPLRSFSEGIEILGRMWALEEENEILRQQIEGVASMQARIDEQKRQIEELKEMNELRSVISDYEAISATVISRSQESWNSLLVIDAGSAEGVTENNAVISTSGLVGKVTSVSEHQAIVKLLTVGDESNKVSVKIHISDSISADAILQSYDFEEQAFVLMLLSSNNTVTENMTVTTSGMGGFFPSGLLVGTVSRVEELSNAIGMNVYVKPAADFSALDYVYVVKRLGTDDE